MASTLTRNITPILSRRLFQRAMSSASWERQYRSNPRLPINMGVLFVPQQNAWIVERMGKFYTILKPGLNFLIPFIDRISYVQILKEIAIDIPSQTAISKDNVALNIDGVLYLKVVDPYLTSYGVDDAEFAITQLAQTTMRSEIGKITLDAVFRERDSLNATIVEAINKASKAWGIDCLRYEIRDVRLPPKVQEAMQMQVEAERRKRAAILESEGVRESEINKAEGTKQATILASEGFRLQQINNAIGEAEAIRAKAEARAKALKVVSDQLSTPEGRNAASLQIAEQYVKAFGNLAKTNNTVLLPSNTGDMSAMVASALSIYNNLQSKGQQGFVDSTSISPSLPSLSTPPPPPPPAPTASKSKEKPSVPKDTQH